MARIVVVGGGVMGSAAAWQLAARGADVTLLERFSAGHTNGSSHGSSRIFRLAYADPFYVSLAARALPLWRRLEQVSGHGVLTLTGAVDHGPPAAVEALQAALRAENHPGQILTPDQAAGHWPGLRFDTSVLFHPTAGRLHADDAVLALQRAAAAANAEVRHGVRVTSLRPRVDGAVDVVTAEDAVYRADVAVVAVGGWTPAQKFAGLPALRVTQEQPVHFPAANALGWPSFIHHGGNGLAAEGGVYGLGSVDGVKVGFHAVGPVVDPDNRDRSLDVAALRRVQEYAQRWLPGVDHTAPAASTCLYTPTPSHDFVADRSGPIVVLAGFSGHGFKFAPVIGQIAADLVAGAPGPARFARGHHLATPGGRPPPQPQPRPTNGNAGTSPHGR